MADNAQSNKKTIAIVVILLLVILLLLLWIRGCKDETSAPESTTPHVTAPGGTASAEAETGHIAVLTAARHAVKIYAATGEKDTPPVADGYSDIPVSVPPGEYRVVIEISDQGIPLGTVGVISGKTTEVPFRGFGSLAVTCPVFDAAFDVLTEDGAVLASGGAGAYPVAVPVGQYQVRMRIGGLEFLKPVEVQEDEKATVAINDFGLLHVTCVKFDHPYTVTDADGKVVAEGSAGVSKLPLLPGNYIVRIVFSGAAVEAPAYVAAGEKQTVEVKGHGQLFVKAPKFDTDYIVKDAAGAEVAAGASGVDKLPLVNGAYTVVCNGQSKSVTIRNSKETVVFE